jgi:N-acetylneuraminate synthase/N,N'-diacetyllegionaminate synthase
MLINSFDLNERVLIVAEIGNNHEGSYALAEELISVAAQAGAGAVKFQTIIPEKLVSVQQTDRVQQLERFRFSYEEFERLSLTAKREGVLFLSTPFDLESAGFLDKLVPAFKISSGDNNFFPLLGVVAQTGKPIILSAGLTDMNEITRSKEFIENVWREHGISQGMAVLHCVANYPVSPEEANLLVISELRERLGVTVGYSDHTLGLEAAVLSVALGARIVEKHFTIDKNYSDFRDHHLSADPKDMAELVRLINGIDELLGERDKKPTKSEVENILRMRRSIVAGHDIPAGTVIQWTDLNWVRPGGGLAPGREPELIGKELLRAISSGEKISPEDLREE